MQWYRGVNSEKRLFKCHNTSIQHCVQYTAYWDRRCLYLPLIVLCLSFPRTSCVKINVIITTPPLLPLPPHRPGGRDGGQGGERVRRECGQSGRGGGARRPHRRRRLRPHRQQRDAATRDERAGARHPASRLTAQLRHQVSRDAATPWRRDAATPRRRDAVAAGLFIYYFFFFL